LKITPLSADTQPDGEKITKISVIQFTDPKVVKNQSLPPHPNPLIIREENVPQFLKERAQWVGWKYEWNGSKWTKPPYHVSGAYKASTTNPKTWSAFDAAYVEYVAGKIDGIGFVLAQGDGLAGIDLDHCIDGEQLTEEAQEIVDQFQDQAYIERSPGGDGIRIFVLGSHKRSGKGQGKENWVEAYDFKSPRYLTVTGHKVGGQNEPQECPEGLDWLHEHYLRAETKRAPEGTEVKPFTEVDARDDDALISRLRKFSNLGPKFVSLFDHGIHYSSDGEVIEDVSAADMALCEMLAFACSRDRDQIDRIFRQSALMRPKWDEKRGSRTYGDITIAKAIDYNLDKGGSALQTSDQKATEAGQTSKLDLRTTLKDLFRPQPFSEINSEAFPLELVENLLPMEGTACIFGQSGSGKTFLAIDLMLAIALGKEDWFGHRIMQRPVIYIALEGEAGVRDRLNAYQLHHGIDIPNNFRIIFQQLDICNVDHQAALIDAIKETGFERPAVFIDTLTRATPGLDLNGPKDMGLVIAGTGVIQRGVGGLVTSIYHSTMKSTDPKGATELGHSSYRGSLDASIQVYVEKDKKYWSARKVKDANDGGIYCFELALHEVRKNQWGNPKTSCCVVPVRTLAIDRGSFISPEQDHAALMDQVENFLVSRLMLPVPEYHTKASLKSGYKTFFCSGKTSCTRDQIEAAISSLIASGRLYDAPLPPDQRQGQKQKYLRPTRLGNEQQERQLLCLDVDEHRQEKRPEIVGSIQRNTSAELSPEEAQNHASEAR
jgi:hypothetical protein